MRRTLKINLLKITVNVGKNSSASFSREVEGVRIACVLHQSPHAVDVEEVLECNLELKPPQLPFQEKLRVCV